MRFWLTLALMVGTTHLWAQPAQPGPAAAATAATTRAQDAARVLERRLGQLSTNRSQLARAYEDQLKAIDRLKQQRASWRRDRELRAKLATAKEAADRLAVVTRELEKLNTELAAARRALAAAIGAERPTAVGARAKQLDELKAQLAPRVRPPAHRIILPDTQINPLADPEELDQLAALLRESESELTRQVVGLEKHAKELDDVAKLRKQHERADAIMKRDDDQPVRTARVARSSGDREDSSAGAPDSTDAPGDPGGSPDMGGGGNGDGGGSGGGDPGGGLGSLGGGQGFEAEAAFVLGDVVDASTIDALTRARRSGDPAKRAAAAKQTRDAVAAKRELIRRKLREIEELKRRAGGR
ncbi:MAG: hypothetical protein AB7R00_15400 [Kofleriaceae bacterium]